MLGLNLDPSKLNLGCFWMLGGSKLAYVWKQGIYSHISWPWGRPGTLTQNETSNHGGGHGGGGSRGSCSRGGGGGCNRGGKRLGGVVRVWATRCGQLGKACKSLAGTSCSWFLHRWHKHSPRQQFIHLHSCRLFLLFCSSSSGVFCIGSFPFSFFLSKSRWYFRTLFSDTWVFTCTRDACCTIKLHPCLKSLHPSQAPVELGMQGFCFFLHRSHYEHKIQVEEKHVISTHLKQYCMWIPTWL